MNSTATPEGRGSVSGAPNLPEGFTDTFTSRYVNAGGLRQHAVIGGEGPPLLLVHGWPETWYAWRLVMPALARDFEVIAVDQRGIGLSDKPAGGYDTETVAADLVALMGALGHERFAVAGHDTGFAISYALAADHPDRVDRVALAEIPGPPGAAPSPPLVRARAAQRPALAPGLQPRREPARAAHRGTRGRVLRLRVRPSRVGSCPTRWSTTTSGSSPSPTSCTEAWGSTGRSTRRSRSRQERKTRASPCPSWPSAERRATATTSARR